jgi:hypothetical protein
MKLGICSKPFGDIIAVLGTLWEWMLRSKSILDGNDGQTRGIGNVSKQWVLEVATKDGVTTTMNMQHDAFYGPVRGWREQSAANGSTWIPGRQPEVLCPVIEEPRLIVKLPRCCTTSILWHSYLYRLR